MLDRALVAGLVWGLAACESAPPRPPASPEPQGEGVVVTVPATSDPPLEPTTPEKRATDPVAVVFVLDRSGSMTGGPMDSAKDATLGAVGELDGSDWVAVIGFDSSASVIVAAQAVSEADVSAAFATLTPGGGTDIFPALQLAYELLEKVDFAHRQVILLTDGQAPISGIRDLVTAMHEDGILVSAVGFGASYDPTLLAMIAETGGGRFHEVPDATSLEGVLRTEVAAFVASTAE